MRTTIRLDSDVLAAAQRLRRERGIGLGEAVNELARAGIRHRPSVPPRSFRQRCSFDTDSARLPGVEWISPLHR